MQDKDMVNEDDTWKVSDTLLAILNSKGAPPVHPYIVAVVGLDKNIGQLDSFCEQLKTLAGKWKDDSKGAPLLLLIPEPCQLPPEEKLKNEREALNIKFVRILVNKKPDEAADKKGGFDGSIAIYTQDVSEQNSTLAEYLAYRCHTLFALGDDVCEELEGVNISKDVAKGAVRYKLKGKPSKTSFDHTPSVALPEGPVVQIDSKNNVFLWTKDDLPPVKNGTAENNAAENGTAKNNAAFYDHDIFKPVLKPLGKATQDDAKHKPKWGRLVKSTLKKEFPGFTVDEESPIDKEDIFFKSYVKINDLANHFKFKKNVGLYCIFFLTFLAALTFSVSSVIQSFPSQLADAMPVTGYLLAYKWWIHLFNIVAFLGLGLFIFVLWRFKGRPVFLSYHRYRALAEIMKVQIYWRAAGISAAVTEFFRPHPVLDDSWFRCWCNGITVSLNSLKNQGNKDDAKRYTQVRDYWRKRITASKHDGSWQWVDILLNSLLVVASLTILGCIVGIVYFDNYISDSPQIFTSINMAAWGLTSLCIVMKTFIFGRKNTGTGSWLGIFLFYTTFLILVSNALTYKLGNGANSLLPLADLNNMLLCFFASLCVGWKVFVGLNQYKNDRIRDQTLHEFFCLSPTKYKENAANLQRQLLFDLGVEVIYANCTWLLSAYDADLTPNDVH